MLPSFVQQYLLTTLAGNPQIAAGLLASLTPDDPRWDAHPYPDRFTLREIVAHLADWESIFMKRIIMTRDASDSLLPNVMVDERAKSERYSEADPQKALKCYQAERALLVETVQALAPDDWTRTAHFIRESASIDEWVTLEAWLVQIVGHDGYHLRQIAEWLHDS